MMTTMMACCCGRQWRSSMEDGRSVCETKTDRPTRTNQASKEAVDRVLWFLPRAPTPTHTHKQTNTSRGGGGSMVGHVWLCPRRRLTPTDNGMFLPSIQQNRTTTILHSPLSHLQTRALVYRRGTTWMICTAAAIFQAIDSSRSQRLSPHNKRRRFEVCRCPTEHTMTMSIDIP